MISIRDSSYGLLFPDELEDSSIAQSYLRFVEKTLHARTDLVLVCTTSVDCHRNLHTPSVPSILQCKKQEIL